MSETEKEILKIILEHISVCEQRFASITQPSDFISSPQGNIILDSIAARLQAIGENIRRVVKHYPELQKKYPEINWDDIARFRDFISHHYELLDHEIVYNICSVHLPVLKSALEKEASQ